MKKPFHERWTERNFFYSCPAYLLAAIVGWFAKDHPGIALLSMLAAVGWIVGLGIRSHLSIRKYRR